MTMAWSGTGGSIHSRINEFVKTCLMKILVDPYSTVCDLYCGFGADTEKWVQAQIGQYIGVDLSASALSEAHDQWEYHRRPYPAEFYELDPCGENLESSLQDYIPTDIVCCLRNLQDCFGSERQARSLLRNVASLLKPGGYFFGVTADSSTIWSKYQKAVEGAIKAGTHRAGGLPRVRSEQYSIYFEDDRFSEFGTKYQIQFSDGLPSQTQLLVHFPSLIRLAREVGLENVEIQNTLEFYEEYRFHFSGILQSTCGNLVDKGRLSHRAHDILSLFTTFIFRKPDYHAIRSISSPSPTTEDLACQPSSDMIVDPCSGFAAGQNHETSNLVELREQTHTDYSNLLEATSVHRTETPCPSNHSNPVFGKPESTHGTFVCLEQKNEVGRTVDSSLCGKPESNEGDIVSETESHICSEDDHPKSGYQSVLGNADVDLPEHFSEQAGNTTPCKGPGIHNGKKGTEIRFYSRSYHNQKKLDGRNHSQAIKSPDTTMPDSKCGRQLQGSDGQVHAEDRKLSGQRSSTVAMEEASLNHTQATRFDRNGKSQDDSVNHNERKNIAKTQQKDGTSKTHDTKEGERNLDEVNNNDDAVAKTNIEKMPGILGPGPQELKFQQPIDGQYKQTL